MGSNIEYFLYIWGTSVAIYLIVKGMLIILDNDESVCEHRYFTSEKIKDGDTKKYIYQNTCATCGFTWKHIPSSAYRKPKVSGQRGVSQGSGQEL